MLVGEKNVCGLLMRVFWKVLTRVELAILYFGLLFLMKQA